jgi:hypothetical protein
MFENFPLEWIEDPIYTELLDDLCDTEEEKKETQDEVQRRRQLGDRIQGTDLRKLRVGLKGKGKQGGARVIYYYTSESEDSFIYAMMIYSKAEKEDITTKEKKTLQAVLEAYLSERSLSHEKRSNAGKRDRQI